MLGAVYRGEDVVHERVRPHLREGGREGAVRAQAADITGSQSPHKTILII